jgi:hypothetical protein
VNRFDVSVYAIRRRPGRRRLFEVRWQSAGRRRSKSFITRKLADSYRAEHVRAARMGLDFDPLTGEPAAWNLPEPATVTWYQEATEYAAMKWPSLAARSRASVAEALATVTPVLVRPNTRRRPDPRELRMVLYRATTRKPAVTPTTRQPRDDCGRRPPCVRNFPARPADGPQTAPTAARHRDPTGKRLASSKPYLRTPTRHPAWPTAGPQTVREPLATARKSRCHHPMTPALTCENRVAGVGFEPT